METTNTTDVNPENIPDDLKRLDQWLCWRGVWDEEKGKLNKVPKTYTGRAGSSTNPDTWTTFDKALEAYEHRKDLDGIGFAGLERTEFLGIDIDNCIDPETGEIQGNALAWAVCFNSYTEISPSGKGLRIWIRAEKAPGSWCGSKKNGREFEVYANGRFFTVTGWRIKGTPRTIEYRQDVFDSFMETEAPPEKPRPERKPYTGSGEYRLELEDFLREFGVQILRDINDSTSEQAFGIVCPWDHEHTGGDTSGTRVGQYSDGALWFHCDHGHCDGRRWEHFREELDPEAYRTFEITFGQGTRDSWDRSDSFSNDKTFVQPPEFPVDALPPKCARFIREAAASLSCPAELVGLPVLTVLSGALGYTRVLRIKYGWEVSACLYAAVVDHPGSKKSPAAGFANKPLEKLQAALRKDYKSERETYDKDMRQHAVDKKRAAKEDEPEPDRPVAPVMKRCIVDDITVEALAVRLEQNPRGVLSAHDELTGFIRGMDQYKSGGKGNARQSYLKIWANAAIYVDRKGSDEPIVIPKPYVTLQGAIQPGVLHEIADGRDDGFLDRFIFAYPEPTPGGYSEDTVSFEAETAYENIVYGFWAKKAQEVEDGQSVPWGVTMDDEAKSLFVSTANALAKEAYSAGFPASLRGPWAKFDTHLARLALIIAMARCVEQQSEHEQVTGEDMRNALQLLEYLKSTTRKVYGQLFEANPDDVLAADLRTLLARSGYVFFGTTTELMEQLDSNALPDTPEALGKAIRRIVKRTPDITLESRKSGDNRLLTITLEKLSEPSQPSQEEA